LSGITRNRGKSWRSPTSVVTVVATIGPTPVSLITSGLGALGWIGAAGTGALDQHPASASSDTNRIREG
jgi:hypothetical protein